MLSHHHRCIFIHIPKCGGSSIEHVFVQLLGLPWQQRAPLLLRPNSIPALGPPRLAHLSAQEYVKCRYVPQSMFDDYLKFTFVRNPWARAASIYYSTAFKQYPDFLSFARARFAKSEHPKANWFSKPQVDFFLNAQGEPAVDFIGRLETINEDFAKLAERLQLINVKLQHHNKTQREAYRSRLDRDLGGKDYRCFYTDESYDIVSNYYRDDIDLLDYQFDNPTAHHQA